MDIIQEEIKRLRNQQNSIKKAKIYLKDLEARIVWAKKKISRIELALNFKFDQLETLKNLKVKKLFSRVLVDKEQQMEEKRQDYLEKFLEFKEAKKSLDFLLYEKQIVLEKVKSEDQVDQRLKALLILREENFVKENPKSSSTIVDIMVKIDKCNLLNREIYEALIEGTKTKKHIATITTNLTEAKTLRNFTFINENEKVYSDEKQHVDKAMEAFYILKPILRKFELELEDIYKNHGFNLSLNLDSLVGFTKKYYNYLINDWIIYEKINVAAKTMNELEVKILEIIDKLEQENIDNKARLKGFETEKQRLLDTL